MAIEIAEWLDELDMAIIGERLEHKLTEVLAGLRVGALRDEGSDDE